MCCVCVLCVCEMTNSGDNEYPTTMKYLHVFCPTLDWFPSFFYEGTPTKKGMSINNNEERVPILAQSVHRRNITKRRRIDGCCSCIHTDDFCTVLLCCPLTLLHWKKLSIRENLARNLCSAERTFQAWVRTGITLIVIGAAVFRCIADKHQPHVVQIIGSCHIICGIIVVIYAWYKSLVLRRLIQKDKFISDRFGPLLLLMTVLGTGILSTLLFYF
jgi:uncharacterized membrane protein YidH (DUF202 family)